MAPNAGLQTVGRAPQSTIKPALPGAPFIRLSRKCQTQGFLVSGVAGGAQITQQLPAAPGFVRALYITVTASGGTGAGAVYQADAPFSAITNIQFKDVNGTTILQLDGYSLYLVNLFSGQVANGGAANPTAQSVFSAGTANGNFTFRLVVPFELNRTGYCSLPAANQNTPMQVIINMATVLTGGAIFSTQPATTQPTFAVQVNQLFWSMVQNDMTISPPDPGASHQWTLASGGQNPTTGSNVKVQSPPLGSWLSTMLGVIRDATASPGPRRVNALPPTDLSLWLDTVQIFSNELYSERQQKILQNFFVPIGTDSAQPLAAGTIGSPSQLTNGVVAYTWRDDVQEEVSAADTFDELLQTTPATRFEIGGTWGTITTGPGTLQFIQGMLYPAGAGIPYTHLAA
jgi:hypothetical protein